MAVTMHEFPDELLCSIFLQSIRPCNTWGVGTTAPPWKIAQVCRRWRAVALDYPELWTWVYVNVLDSRYTPSVPMLQLWLERSRGQPLDIAWKEWFVDYYETIDDYEGLGDEDGELIEHDISSRPLNKALSVILLAQMRRCRTIQIVWGSGFFNPKNQEAPILEFLDIRDRDDNIPVESHSNHPLLGLIAPKLHHLKVSMGDPRPQPGALLVIPQQSNVITHVDLGYWLSTRDILDFIRTYPSLKHFGITGPHDDDTSGDVSADVITHNSIAVLKCDGLFASIFSRLRLPALKLLYLNTVLEDDIEAAVPFIARSGCNLERLDLYGAGYTDDQNFVLKMLEVTPQLRFLKFAYAHRLVQWATLFNVLSQCSTTDAVLVPKLEYLMIDEGGIYEPTNFELSRFILARSDVTGTTENSQISLWKFVSIQVVQNPWDEHPEELEKLEEIFESIEDDQAPCIYINSEVEWRVPWIDNFYPPSWDDRRLGEEWFVPLFHPCCIKTIWLTI